MKKLRVYTEEQKAAKKANDRAYYLRNRDEIVARSIKWQVDNPLALKNKNKQYYADNSEKIKEATSKYYAENTEAVSLQTKKYREANKQNIAIKNKEYRKQYLQENLDKHCATQNKRRARKICATPKWANETEISKLYATSKLMSELSGIEHSVDHIVPLKSKLVCGLHCEHNLAVIPAADNKTKSNRYWPDMP